jgi:PAS domain S-box-containing protein
MKIREKIFKEKKGQAISISPKGKYVIVILTAVVLLTSVWYINFTWRRYNDMASSKAVQLAQSLEAMLHPPHLRELSPEDIDNEEYNMAKASLIHLVEKTSQIHSAYIMVQRGNDIIILIDSTAPGSPDYLPPGEVYREADEWLKKPFEDKKTVITPKRQDAKGEWVSALAPVIDPENGEVIALFRIDYSASQWYGAIWQQMHLDITVILIVLLLYFALLYISLQHSALNKLNKKLAFSEVIYRSVFNQAPVGIAIVRDKNFVFHSDMEYASINPMLEEILGIKSDELVNIKWTDITHPEDLQPDLEQFEKFQKGEINGYSMEKRFIRPDGSAVWTYMIISPLLGIYDNHSAHLCLLKDISERKEAELALKESERRETVLLSNLPGLAYRGKYDKDRTMLLVSEGCRALTGYEPQSFTDNKDLVFGDIIDAKYKEQLWARLKSAVINKRPYSCEYEITAASGERKWVLEIGQGLYNEKGEPEALEGLILDISHRKDMENRLRYLNEHDKLTNLYNREYLEYLLEKDLAKKDGQKRALININLSTVNLFALNYGFHYMQNLLKKAAEELDKHCSANRMLFKTYENRFVFYITGYKDKEELIKFSGEIADSMQKLFATERINGGIGILEIKPEDGDTTADSLLRRLIIASERSLSMFEKAFCPCFYDEKLEALVNRENDIKHALAAVALDDPGAELTLQYQPIYDVRLNRICCFEALARLKTDKLGQVPPTEFISIAEKTKLIIPIGEKVIRRAFEFLKKLKDSGYHNVDVSVNISAIQLMQPDFADRFRRIKEEMNINPNNVHIEITESVFASDYDNINNTIEKLRNIGISISIDDFGTGYSSLARENELSVDCMKIDKYFVDKLMDEDLNRAIIADIISMAHKLGHCAVAEGVEHESQLHFLIKNNCDKIQGYLISKPLEEHDALEFLKNQPKK